MFDTVSPELVLVLPANQRAAAIRALPTVEPWRPSRPLATAPAQAKAAFHVLLGTALLYFLAKLVVTVGGAAAVVLALVAVVVGASLLL
jgi:hypothetical protein